MPKATEATVVSRVGLLVSTTSTVFTVKRHALHQCTVPGSIGPRHWPVRFAEVVPAWRSGRPATCACQSSQPNKGLMGRDCSTRHGGILPGRRRQLVTRSERRQPSRLSRAVALSSYCTATHAVTSINPLKEGRRPRHRARRPRAVRHRLRDPGEASRLRGVSPVPHEDKIRPP